MEMGCRYDIKAFSCVEPDCSSYAYAMLEGYGNGSIEFGLTIASDAPLI